MLKPLGAVLLPPEVGKGTRPRREGRTESVPEAGGTGAEEVATTTTPTAGHFCGLARSRRPRRAVIGGAGRENIGRVAAQGTVQTLRKRAEPLPPVETGVAKPSTAWRKRVTDAIFEHGGRRKVARAVAEGEKELNDVRTNASETGRLGVGGVGRLRGLRVPKRLDHAGRSFITAIRARRVNSSGRRNTSKRSCDGGEQTATVGWSSTSTDAVARPPTGRTPGDPSSERGSDSAAPLSKGDANQIRHHQPQELTVRENGASPSYGVYCAGGGPTPRSHDV